MEPKINQSNYQSYQDKVKVYRKYLSSQAFTLQKMGEDLVQVAEEVATNPETGNLRNLSGLCKAAIDAYNAANDRNRELLELDWVIERLIDIGGKPDVPR